MSTLLSTSIGRLRIVGYLEATTLLLLVFLAVPLKYGFGYESLTAMIGPLHGALFLLFVINTWTVSLEQRWKFSDTTWKVLLACIIPFGTFYVDRTILSKL